MLINASISDSNYSSRDLTLNQAPTEQEKTFFNVPKRDPITSFYPDNVDKPQDLQEKKMREAFSMIDKSSEKYTSFKDLQIMLQGQIIEKR